MSVGVEEGEPMDAGVGCDDILGGKAGLKDRVCLRDPPSTKAEWMGRPNHM